MKPFFFPALLGALLAACGAQPVRETLPHDPERTARIRLFGQNQKPSAMTFGKDCALGKVSVGGSLGDAFRSFTRSADNESLGIPETETTRQLSQRDGILSKAFYREFVIPAGSLVNVRAAFIGLTTTLTHYTENMKYETVYQEPSHKTRITSFTPEAGKDYEAIGVKEGGKEIVIILEVAADGSLQPAPSEPSICR
ncbi:MAG: hypothetical protein LBF93_11590 [Zoogloeaceae bacterium]|jgi:hypothetical protein|nr:hypothetical protein [Zoogloeaceae bacterium]